jgi:hypothetical protein
MKKLKTLIVLLLLSFGAANIAKGESHCSRYQGVSFFSQETFTVTITANCSKWYSAKNMPFRAISKFIVYNNNKNRFSVNKKRNKTLAL